MHIRVYCDKSWHFFNIHTWIAWDFVRKYEERCSRHCCVYTINRVSTDYLVPPGIRSFIVLMVKYLYTSNPGIFIRTNLNNQSLNNEPIVCCSFVSNGCYVMIEFLTKIILWNTNLPSVGFLPIVYKSIGNNFSVYYWISYPFIYFLVICYTMLHIRLCCGNPYHLPIIDLILDLWKCIDCLPIINLEVQLLHQFQYRWIYNVAGFITQASPRITHVFKHNIWRPSH